MQRRYAYAAVVAAILLALAALRRRRRLRTRDADVAIALEPAVEPVILESFEAARAMDGGAAILRGDGGRYIYATVPAARLDCDDATLLALLFALDARACDRPEGATIAFEVAPVGAEVASEFGTAPVVDGLWLHPNFAQRGLTPYVADVLANRRTLDDALRLFPRPLPRDAT